MPRDKKPFRMGREFYDQPLNSGATLEKKFRDQERGNDRLAILEKQVAALKQEQIRFLREVEKTARACPFTVTDKGFECPVIREIYHQIDRLKGKVQS